jgi:protein-L-isoaspartate(D-aspartate) O-methyltransferase
MDASQTLLDNGIEQALLRCPRHLYLPNHSLEEAYADDAVLTKERGGCSSCSQPSLVVTMLSHLDVSVGDNVLEIGAGSGWNSALIRQLVGPEGKVTSIDIDDEMVAFALANQQRNGIDGVHIVCGDGALGYAPGQPYDRIIVTAGVSDISPHWIEALRPGGRLVVPIWFNTLQYSVAFDLNLAPDRELVSVAATQAGFMPLRGAFAEAVTRDSKPDFTVEYDASAGVPIGQVVELLGTPARSSTVAALDRPESFRFVEYLGLTGQALVRLHYQEKSLHPYCFYHDNSVTSIVPEYQGPGTLRLLPEVATYGGNPSLERLLELARQWGEQGCPGIGAGSLVVAPHEVAPHGVTPSQGGVLHRRKYHDYYSRAV